MQDKIRKKLNYIDQEILNLIKKDESEMQILRENDKLETLQKEINAKEQEVKEQRQLVKELIKKKNLEARAQKQLVKELTKRNKKHAQRSAEKEVEELYNIKDLLEEISLDKQ